MSQDKNAMSYEERESALEVVSQYPTLTEPQQQAVMHRVNERARNAPFNPSIAYMVAHVECSLELRKDNTPCS